jgi:SSS family solute:Na+ symporter
MLQVFPTVVFGLFMRWFRSGGLLAGWALGMILGTALSASVGMKPIFTLPELGGVYIGLIALVANIALAALVTVIANARGLARAADVTQSADYEDAPILS